MKRRRKGQDLIDWRRFKVIESISKGQTQSEIANALFVGIGTVNRDLSWFREQAREYMTKFVERIQEEHEKSMIGLNAILREAWTIMENAKTSKEKLQALSLAKDCYALKEELLCNMPVIEEALKFESESELEKSENYLDETPRPAFMGVKEKDDIQRSQEKDREGPDRKTANKTF